MSDLEKFLQQAAQRMKERQQAAQQPARPATSQQQSSQQSSQQQPPQAQRPPQPQRPPQTQQQPSARPATKPQFRNDERRAAGQQGEILEAQLVDHTLRELGPNRLSNLDTRAAPGTTDVSMSDERLTEHLQQTFDHTVGKLPKGANQAPVSTVVANEQTNRKIEVETQRQDVHWVSELLQHSESLRSAFIASEIFKRRF